MASSKEYLDFILEQLSELNDITYKAMMGEYIIYYQGKIVGGIYDDRFLVKLVKSASKLMPNAEHELPYEGAKEMLLVDDVANKLIEYIEDNFDGKIKVLCGLSLGAQIAVEILSQANSICDYALIESVSLVPSKIAEILIGPAFSMSYGLIKKKWFSQLQFKSLHIDKSFYEEYYRDTCLITRKDMIAFLKANTRYSLCNSIKNSKAIIKVIVGGKEQSNMIKSAKQISEVIPNAILAVKSDLYHGEFSLNKPDEYVKELKELIT